MAPFCADKPDRRLCARPGHATLLTGHTRKRARLELALNDYTRRLAQIATAPRATRRLPRKAVFLHIPKTAGSSVHAYFMGLVGRAGSGQLVMIDDQSPDTRLSLARRARYVGGHFGARQLARLSGEAYRFTFLRDPLERLISAWRFATTTRAGAALARFDDLETALASDDPILHEGFDNVIARQLGAAYAIDAARSVARDEWVERAVATLESLDFVGALETIDADFARIRRDLGITTETGLGRRNATDDTRRKGWQGNARPAQIERTQRLEELAAPWIALDRAVINAWQAARIDRCGAFGHGRGTDPD